MDELRRSVDQFFHPTSEDELIALVKRARREGVALRVRGSGHSVEAAIYTDGHFKEGTYDIDVSLDRYTGVEFDDVRRRVTVQAGCRLGADPRDPTGLASFDVSLVAQLERRGWALPDLGGVSHQTVAGFFMTGSCGGTVRYSNEDAIVAFRFIDGEGRAHDVERGCELFDAFGCSMGLFGIVSTITFECPPRYDVIGREDTREEDDAAVDLFAPGALERFLRETEYARLMWWPQAGVRRVVTWRAARMCDADYTEDTGPRGSLRTRPYDAMNLGIDSPLVRRGASLALQWAGGKFYDVVALGRTLARRAPVTARAVAPLFLGQVLPRVLDQFVPLGEPQVFWDSWCHALPLDDQISDSSLPTTFTEMWVPLERAHEVMSLLAAHFRAHEQAATGTFAFEIYAARASRYWMHPGYGRDSLRIDVFWFARNPEDPATFFRQYWELLRPFEYRLHWGKHLPEDDALGVDYLRARYPRWHDFLALRAALDPAGTFLNRHFARALGIAR